MFFSHNDVLTLTNTLNSEILELSDWFKANKLNLRNKQISLNLRSQTMYSLN